MIPFFLASLFALRGPFHFSPTHSLFYLIIYLNFRPLSCILIKCSRLVTDLQDCSWVYCFLWWIYPLLIWYRNLFHKSTHQWTYSFWPIFLSLFIVTSVLVPGTKTIGKPRPNRAEVKWNIVCVSFPLSAPRLCPPEKCMVPVSPSFRWSLIIYPILLGTCLWASFISFVDIWMHLFSPERVNFPCGFRF